MHPKRRPNLMKCATKPSASIHTTNHFRSYCAIDKANNTAQILHNIHNPHAGIRGFSSSTRAFAENITLSRNSRNFIDENDEALAKRMKRYEVCMYAFCACNVGGVWLHMLYIVCVRCVVWCVRIYIYYIAREREKHDDPPGFVVNKPRTCY